MFKRKLNITRIKKNEKSALQDLVLIEKPIDLYVNSQPIVNIMCLPIDLKELAVGFLFSIGIINSYKDIRKIEILELKKKILVELHDSVDFKIEDIDINTVSRVVDTTCGISSPWRKLIKNRLDEANIKEKLWSDDFTTLKANIIFNSIKKMQLNTTLYRETGGCHGAAIFDFEGNLLSVKEDIGRHNAIDKVIGDLIIRSLGFKNVFLTSTGRLTSDSVLKSIRANIPIIVSHSAAIESGIKLAFAYGITLIGFARGRRMNIYTHPDRIKM